MPFADGEGVVAVLLRLARQRRERRGRQGRRAADDRADPVLARVEPREQGRARRRAEGLHPGGVEAHPTPGQAVDDRQGDRVGMLVVRADQVRPDVVEHNDQDVGPHRVRRSGFAGASPASSQDASAARKQTRARRWRRQRPRRGRARPLSTGSPRLRRRRARTNIPSTPVSHGRVIRDGARDGAAPSGSTIPEWYAKAPCAASAARSGWPR